MTTLAEEAGPEPADVMTMNELSASAAIGHPPTGSNLQMIGADRELLAQRAPAEVFVRESWQRRYAVSLRITDTAVVCGAVVLAQFFRFGWSAGYQSLDVVAYSCLLVIVWLSGLAGFHARSARVIGRGVDEYRRVVEASLWTFGAIAILDLLLKIEMARGYLAVALPVGILGLLLSRHLWRGYVADVRVEGKYQTAVLVIGNEAEATHLVNELTRNPKEGYQVVGACLTGSGALSGEMLSVQNGSIRVFGSEAHAMEAIRECGADTVAIAGTDCLGVQGIRRLLWDLEPMDVDLLVSPGVMDVALSRLAMRPVAGLPLLHIEKPQYRGAKRFQKRAFDFCFALFALTAATPILILAALAIKMNSKGPVFYSSERVGMDGARFPVLKLRTMVQDAEKKLVNLLESNECDGSLFKMRNDPRITSVGRVLRRFSIDELPQFINVLRREMSVVGPRPLIAPVAEERNSDSERRLLVKPGITGLWQVSGRSDLSWDDSIRLDLSYVDNWSMAADLVIIARTLRAVVAHQGAY